MYNPDVFISHFDKLLLKKSALVGRRLSLRDVAAGAKISLVTVHKASRGPLDTLSLASVKSLCAYFEVKRLTDLIEWQPDPPTDEKADKAE